MERLSVIIFIFAFLGSCSLNQAFSDEHENSPDIRFEEREYDFGFAGQQEQIIYDFRFVNGGDGTLMIEAAKSSCGCIATVVPNKEVLPGAAGIVRVSFQTGNYKGEQARTVVVHSNDPDEPELELKVTGVIETDIAIQPEFLYFGDVDKGKSITKTVRLIQIGNKPIELERVDAVDKFFSTRVSPFDDKRHKGFEIDVTLKPDVPVGLFTELMTLNVNLRKRPRIDVPVSGYVLGSIRAKPRTVSLATTEKGGSAAGKTIVTSIGRENFNILKVVSEPPCISTEITPLRDKRAFEIHLKANVSELVGNRGGRIIIHTDDPRQSLIEVPVYGPDTEPRPEAFRMPSLPLPINSQPTEHVYITRIPVEEDTYVSAWLIKRFLDPVATFVFVSAASRLSDNRGNLFDLPTSQARWRRTHRTCTCEHLLTEIQKPDPAVKKIVAMVRKLEMGPWLVSPTSDEARLRSSLLKIANGVEDPYERIDRVFLYFDKAYAADGNVPQ